LTTDWVQAATGIGSLVVGFIGLAAVYVQLARARREAQVAHDRQNTERLRIKKQETLNFARSTLDFRYTAWSELADDFSSRAVALMIDQSYSKDLHGSEDGSEPQDRSKTLKKALEYLGILETFAIGIFQDVYDAETAYELYGSRLIAVAGNYKPLIVRRRADTGRGSLYEWLEKLAHIFSTHKNAEHHSFHDCGCLNARPPELPRGIKPDGEIANSKLELKSGSGVYVLVRGKWRPAVVVSNAPDAVMVEFALGPRPIDQRRQLVVLKRVRIPSGGGECVSLTAQPKNREH
jgi:hypothetical protein